MQNRRFFFDDGTSRKRWEISQRGRRQIVRYGRIGSSLRSVEYECDTPAYAREDTESLIAEKVSAGYIEIDPQKLTIDRPKKMRPATLPAIKALEKTLDMKLPAEYRAFLQTQNGGEPEPYYMEVPGVKHIANVGVGYLYGLYPKVLQLQSLSWAIDFHSKYLPPNHLPIAYYSDVFTLSLKDKPGCVYFWDHESMEVDRNERFLKSAGHLLAGSFDEFLTRIAIFKSDEES